MKIESYVCGQWVGGVGPGVEVRNAVNGEPVGRVSSAGVDFRRVLEYARTVGGPALRKLTFHDRARRLKAVGQRLMERKESFYAVSAWTGATRADSWIDIEGGIGTLFSYSSLVRRELADETFIVEGEMEALSKKGSFIGRHVLVPREGVAVHINAFNFPCWGMLEKIAPSLAAGMPVVVKPASVSCYLALVMVQEIIASGLLPAGALQLICGSIGDLFEHLTEQDAVTFTGSASTGRQLKGHPAILNNSVPFNLEADSLNCSILGASVTPDQPEFELFLREVVREMTVKAGQKCTAIRRIIVPAPRVDAVADLLKQRLAGVVIGDPAMEGVKMGPLIGRDQVRDVWENVRTLRRSCELVHGGSEDFVVQGGDRDNGAFFPTTLLHCPAPLRAEEPHAVEAFGPVSTILPYADTGEAIELARRGHGSLCGSLFTADDEEAREIVLGTAAWHGRLMLINRESAGESTGHGSPLPNLVHGGPGRAGGGEELGGVRAIKHFMQRTALQGSPATLTAVTREFHPGARLVFDVVHPFRKCFEDLVIGESVQTAGRTITEADIESFGNLTGDRFYAHFDEAAARKSLFGRRVAHGYFVISAAAGLFVDPAPGPVLANYGLDNLRFIEPVGIGDTIQVRLTVKRKIRKEQRDAGDPPTGVVVWAAEIRNQHERPVALYDVLTLVQRRAEAA